MINLDIPCKITYQLQGEKVVATISYTIHKGFDFKSLQKILEVYNPLISEKEGKEEKEALKKISDYLLNIISTKVITNE